MSYIGIFMRYYTLMGKIITPNCLNMSQNQSKFHLNDDQIIRGNTTNILTNWYFSAHN